MEDRDKTGSILYGFALPAEVGRQVVTQPSIRLFGRNYVTRQESSEEPRTRRRTRTGQCDSSRTCALQGVTPADWRRILPKVAEGPGAARKADGASGPVRLALRRRYPGCCHRKAARRC